MSIIRRLRHRLAVLAVAVLLGAIVVLGSDRVTSLVAVAPQDGFAGLVDIGGGRRLLPQGSVEHFLVTIRIALFPVDADVSHQRKILN
jgi:hypothetical protein